MKVLQDTILHVQPSKQYGICVVGIYGVGGMGKTTLCKRLCNSLSHDYDGKAIHIELGSESSCELLKEVLKDLMNTNQDFLQGLDEGKVFK